jgi:chromosome segregation ATPase
LAAIVKDFNLDVGKLSRQRGTQAEEYEREHQSKIKEVIKVSEVRLEKAKNNFKTEAESHKQTKALLTTRTREAHQAKSDKGRLDDRLSILQTEMDSARITLKEDKSQIDKRDKELTNLRSQLSIRPKIGLNQLDELKDELAGVKAQLSKEKSDHSELKRESNIFREQVKKAESQMSAELQEAKAKISK